MPSAMPSLVRLLPFHPLSSLTPPPEFGALRLSDRERDWLKNTCPYFHGAYLDYLKQYRFKPDQVSIRFIPSEHNPDRGDLEIEAAGPWLDTILWEVPLMACLSELYFRLVDTDWNYEGQEGSSLRARAAPVIHKYLHTEQAYAKGEELIQFGCAFSEFGTRRRRSFHTQDIVIRGLARATKDFPGPGKLSGTSNVSRADTMSPATVDCRRRQGPPRSSTRARAGRNDSPVRPL